LAASNQYERLKALLEQLFQLDQPDLDFGFYRVMHARASEVKKFLEQDLLPQVQESFELYRPADRAAIEGELLKAIQQAKDLGADPDQVPKVAELRKRLESEGVDIAALEQDVYEHLFRFFRRYYSEGDLDVLTARARGRR
jgi:adenine-specific DNA-methyltransferase